MIKATEILSFDWLLPYFGEIYVDHTGLCEWTVNRILERSSDCEQYKSGISAIRHPDVRV